MSRKSSMPRLSFLFFKTLAGGQVWNTANLHSCPSPALLSECILRMLELFTHLMTKSLFCFVFFLQEPESGRKCVQSLMMVHIVLGLMWKMCLNFFHSSACSHSRASSWNLTLLLSSVSRADVTSSFTFLLLSHWDPVAFQTASFYPIDEQTNKQTNTAHESLFQQMFHIPGWSTAFPLLYGVTFLYVSSWQSWHLLYPSDFLFPSFILFLATSSPVKEHESSYNYPFIHRNI